LPLGEDKRAYIFLFLQGVPAAFPLKSISKLARILAEIQTKDFFLLAHPSH
jgi:hypothetical protein